MERLIRLPERRGRAGGAWLLCAALAAAPALAGQTAPPAGPPLDEAAPEELTQGQRLFDIHCSRCHGLGGVGGEGPNLMRENLRRSTTDEALLSIVEDGIEGTDMPGAWTLNGQEIRGVAAYVRSLGTVAREDLPGDPARGRDLYDATLCSTCHVVNGEGIAFGPDLSDIGLLRGSEHLRESIRDPAASVTPRYRTVLVEDAGGAETMGVRMNEDTFTIQILDQAGRLRSFRKTEIRRFELLPEESLMMSYADFGDDELDDLVAYLATLRGPEGGPSR